MLLRARRPAAELRADARQELLATEGLRDVVVGARAQAAYLVELVGVRREHDHRCLAQLADAFEHLPAGKARHRDVEDDDIGVLGVEEP